MQFRVITGHAPVTDRDVVHLRHTGWDDWFKFSTLYNAAYVDADGKPHEIGGAKIGRAGLLPAGKGTDREGHRYPNPPKQFNQLEGSFFSLGQDASFYEALTDLGAAFRDTFLKAMRDIAYAPELLRVSAQEEVTRVSLLREVPIVTVREQLHRLAHGGVRLTPYEFTFRLSEAKPEPLKLRFSVDPDSRPPSNIQVLIGRNGVGKSTLLNRLAKALVKGSDGQVEPRSGTNCLTWSPSRSVPCRRSAWRCAAACEARPGRHAASRRWRLGTGPVVTRASGVASAPSARPTPARRPRSGSRRRACVAARGSTSPRGRRAESPHRGRHEAVRVPSAT